MINVGGDEAAELLAGSTTGWTRDHNPWTHADRLFETVDRIWMKPRTEDCEEWDLVDEGTEGAKAITRIWIR